MQKTLTLVIEDQSTNVIIASGSLVQERKFIRNQGYCGHIEDIVVHKTYRRQNLGFIIVDGLTKLAFQNKDMYKVILDCSENN
jgi:glucosamine-phosphate N-acetyltransferase